MGIDPLELRRRNLVPPSAMPYTNAVGQVYDSGEYAENMDRALEIADWDGFQRAAEAAPRAARLLGRGFANYVESSIGAPKERAEIEVKPEGTVEVVIGTQPSGQGHETSFAQVVADLIEVPVETVSIILGDTDIVSVGGGSHSGPLHAPRRHRLAMAARRSRRRRARAAPPTCSMGQRQRVFETAAFARATGTSRHRAVRACRKRTLRRKRRAARASCATTRCTTPVFPNGAAVCEVEVDPDTGHVADHPLCDGR